MKKQLATILCVALSITIAGAAFPATAKADSTKASRDAARKEAEKEAAQKKADQAKEAKDVQAAKEAQAAADAKAAKDAQAAKAQSKKISTLILHGGLPKDDLDALDTQLKSLADLEKSLTKGETKLSRDELKQLFDAVGTSTLTLWQAKQGTSATQTTIYHLGSSVLVKADFATKLLTGDLTRSDAHSIARDFHQLLDDEKELVAGDSAADARTKTQSQYNDLLSKYFEARVKPVDTAG